MHDPDVAATQSGPDLRRGVTILTRSQLFSLDQFCLGVGGGSGRGSGRGVGVGGGLLQQREQEQEREREQELQLSPAQE